MSLGDGLSFDVSIKFLGDLLVRDGNGGLIAVDVGEDGKLGGLGDGDGGLLEVDVGEDCEGG